MRWKCTIAYDGTDFEGWQSQPGGKTIQDLLEKRLRTVFEAATPIHGSGRTDAGVHARRQVFHFDAEWKHGAEKLVRALRSGLPDSIQIVRARQVRKDFHARFSATGKRYIYQIQLGRASPFETRYFWSLGRTPLDLARMRAAADLLPGKRDFAPFAATRGSGADPQNTVRDLRRLEVSEAGSQIFITAEADGFLYKMMRSLAGFLVDCGQAKIDFEQATAIVESKQRSHLVQTAPARGLILDRVFYSEDAGAGRSPNKLL